MKKPIKRILIIDDDRKAVGVLRTAFEKKQFEVREAYDVERGLALLREQAPDILLLDLLFPHTGGLDALSSIRGEQAFATLPVIILTNYSNAEITDPLSVKYHVTVMIKTESSLKDIVSKAETLLGVRPG